MAHPLPQQRPTTPVLVAAKRRSDLYGLDPSRDEIPHKGDPGPAAHTLRNVAAPVFERLLDQIHDTSLALVMADREGRLTRREAPRSATLRAMDERSVDVGFSLAETDVGTNGVGTSLEARTPTVVVGDQHYLEAFHPFTCANAPIVDPITRRISGTVGIVCPVKDTEKLMLSTAVQVSQQITELLFQQAKPNERLLLDVFLRERRTASRAFAAMGEGVFIATPTAQRLLVGIDQNELWARVAAATRRQSSGAVELTFERPSSPPLQLLCTAIHQGGIVGGAAVEFATDTTSRSRPATRSVPPGLGSLVGQSASWHRTVQVAREAAQHRVPTLIVGERGTGRMAIASAVAELQDAGEVIVMDSSTVLLEGERVWLQRAQAALVRGATILLRRVDELPDEMAGALAQIVATSESPVIATTNRADAADPGMIALKEQLNVFRVEVAPLRDRRMDIAPLVRHLVGQLGSNRVEGEAIAALHRQDWPGNVTELRQVLRAAHARAQGRAISLDELADSISVRLPRLPLHGLRQQEANAIVDALRATTSRTEAAKILGISRATLYRRIAAYGLDG